MSAAQTTETTNTFYVVGGTLGATQKSYIQRQADKEIYDGLKQGDFCYVLTSRQMGKSSLMIRTAHRLKEEGINVAVLDLTSIGQNLTPEQWYDGLLTSLGEQFRLTDDLEDFWDDNERLGVLQRWMKAIRDVVLVKKQGQIVICIDEIDAVRSLPFSTDEFFAGLREFYNRRTQDPELNRLTFCLFGVATPSDLIKDTRTTPFNIGKRIDLGDFTIEQAQSLAIGLRKDNNVDYKLIERVLYWTGGQPYLTQRLCKAIAQSKEINDVKGVDKLCQELFLSPQAREQDNNLLFVRERILRSEVDLGGLLEIYRNVRKGKEIQYDPTNPLIEVLRLSGIIRVSNGNLVLRNQIYQTVFDNQWIDKSVPDAEVKRIRAARNKAYGLAFAISALVILVVGGLAFYAFAQAKRAEDQTKIAKKTASELKQALLKADAATELAKAEAERANTKTAEAKESTEQALESEAKAKESAKQALGSEAKANEALRNSEIQKQEALNQKNVAQQEVEKSRNLLYIANIQQAKVAYEQDNNADLIRRLNREWHFPGDKNDLRGPEWSSLAQFVFCFSTLEGHTSSVFSVAITRDGKKLVSGSKDNTIKIWDLTNNTLISTLQGHTSSVFSVAITGDGKKLVSGSSDNTIKIWDLTNNTLISTLEGHTNSVFSVAITGDGKKLVSSGLDNTIKIWDLTNNTLISTLKGHTDDVFSSVLPSVFSVAITGDGKKLVSSGLDNTIKIWDLTNNTLISTLKVHTNAVLSSVSSVAITGDGKKLVSGSSDNTIKIWDLTNNTLISTLKGHTSSVFSVAITGDGKKLVSGSDDTTIKIWDLTNNTLISTLQGHTNAVFSIAITEDGKKLVSGSDNTIKIWDLTNNPLISTLQGHTRSVLSVAIAGDGKKLVSGSDDTTIKIWDLTNNTLISTLKGHTDDVSSVAITEDGKKLVSGSKDNTIKIWDLTNNTLISTLKGHTDYVFSVAITEDGKKLVSGSDDTTIKIWDLTNNTLISTLKGHTDDVSSVAITGDGKKLVSSGLDNTIKIWDLTNNTLISTLQGHTNAVYSIAITRDGKKLVSGSKDNTIKIWDLTNNSLISTLKGHTDDVFSVAITGDGKKLVSGSKDNTIKIWDLTNNSLISTLTGHTNAVLSVAITGDGKNLVSGSSDKTIRVYKPVEEINKNVGFLVSVSQTQIEDGNFAKAYQVLQFAYEVATKDSQKAQVLEQLNELASSQINAKNFPLAELIYRFVIDKDPNNARSLDALGYFLSVQNKNLAEAESLLQRALKIEPKNPYYLDSLAWIYFKQGRFEQANTLMQEVIKLGGDGPIILEHLADSYLRVREEDKAIEFWKEALGKSINNKQKLRLQKKIDNPKEAKKYMNY